MRRKERLAFVRRALLLEGLERRSMLSGMVGDSPWQNPLDADDLNCDGMVTPSDALTAINAINGGMSIDASGKLTPPQLKGDFATADTNFLDADGDGRLSPGDALSVINAINASANGGIHAADMMVPDQVGTLGSDAQVIDLTQGFGRARGVISDASDVDVFQVAPTKSELSVALFSHGGGAVSVTILASDGTTTLGTAAIEAGTHHPAKTSVTVEAGKTYYLQVQGDGGPYALGVLNFESDDFTPNPSPAPDVGDTTATAGALVLNHGHARVISSIDSAGDADVFAVTADVDGKLIVEADGEIPLSVDVSDTSGSLGAFKTADQHAIVVNATAGGTYYVTVTAANGTDTGAYHLNVVNAPVHEPGGHQGPPEGDHTPPGLDHLFAKVDADSNGVISLVEFEDVVPGHHAQIADQLFKSWDTDNNGALDVDEFVAGLQTLPPVLPHHAEAGPGPAGPLVTGE